MRALIAILVLGAVAVAGGYLLSESFADEGKTIGIAFGFPKEGEIEMHAIISNRMAKIDPPKLNVRGKISWQEWVDDHFAMFDDAGGAVPLKYRKSTDMMSNQELRGFQRGFVIAHLKQGVDYSMEYRPVSFEDARYHHSFTAPADKVSLTRPLYRPVN